MSSSEVSDGGMKTPVVTVGGPRGQLDQEFQVYRDLWASVLALGISDYILAASHAEAWELKEKTEPILWFESPAQTYGSFTWCCELLDWNPKHVRAKVLERKSQKREELLRTFLSVVE